MIRPIHHIWVQLLVTSWSLCILVSDTVGQSERDPCDSIFHHPGLGRSVVFAQHRILGGYKASSGEFPSYAHLVSHNREFNPLTEGKICGASILDELHVITAAHCIMGIPNYVGYVEPAYLMPKSYTHKVVKICVSDQYKRGDLAHSDVAVLKLDKPIIFDNDKVKPAAISFDQLIEYDDIFAVGLGMAYWNPTGGFPEQLRALDAKPQACPSTIDPAELKAVCLRPSNPDLLGRMCQGDSGGPIYVRRGQELLVAGVSSFTPRNCSLDNEDIFGIADFVALKAAILRMIQVCA